MFTVGQAHVTSRAGARAAQVRADRVVVAERTAGQRTVHEQHGGVVPRLAAAAHARSLPDLVRAYGQSWRAADADLRTASLT